MIKKINLLLRKNNIDLSVNEKSIIDSFEMNKEYFLDVFLIRHNISLELNKPIIGLKEVLDNVEKIKNDKILSTSIKTNNIDIILYSDESYLEFYGVISFSSHHL